MTHKIKLFISLLFLLLNMQLTAQKKDALSLSVPETEGVSSEDIINFLDAAGKEQNRVS